MSYQTDLPCIACGEGFLDRCFHHIKTRKAYPELSEKHWNKMPLCAKCHSGMHGIGLGEMVKRNKKISDWLTAHGWYYYAGKLMNNNE